MKIFLGANNLLQVCEASSWSDLLIEPCFKDVEEWIALKEEAWGEASVFVEIVMPRGKQPSGHNNQFDLIICFGSRLAVVEMKRHWRASDIKLDDTLFQIDGQLRWMRGILRDAGYDPDRAFPFLFCPHLPLQELANLRFNLRDLHSAWHVWAVGAQSEMRGRLDDESRPFFFRDALEQRLNGSFLKSLPQHQGAIASFLQSRLYKAGAKVLEFDSFSNAHSYLRSVGPARQRFIWEPWHVRNLFPAAVECIVNLINQYSFVEVAGPPGSGKSNAIKEFIESHDEDFVEARIRKATTRVDVALAIHQALHGEPGANIGETTLFRALTDESAIFWVREYDQASLPALVDFFAMLKTLAWLSRNRRHVAGRADAVSADRRCCLIQRKRLSANENRSRPRRTGVGIKAERHRAGACTAGAARNMQPTGSKALHRRCPGTPGLRSHPHRGLSSRPRGGIRRGAQRVRTTIAPRRCPSSGHRT